MRLKPVFLLLLISIPGLSYAQLGNIWVTYSEPKLVHSPGIELNYFIANKLGIQAGVAFWIRNFEDREVASVRRYAHSFYHNANFGIAYNVYDKTDHKVGLTTGLKMYNGSDFEVLAYNETDDYYIYYDNSRMEAEFGLDLGFFHTYKRFSSLVKWDSRRKNLRIGFGLGF